MARKTEINPIQKIEQLEREAEEAKKKAVLAGEYKEQVSRFSKSLEATAKMNLLDALLYGDGGHWYDLFSSKPRISEAPDFIQDFFLNNFRKLEARLLQETDKPYGSSGNYAQTTCSSDLEGLANIVESAQNQELSFNLRGILLNLVRNYRPSPDAQQIRTISHPPYSNKKSLLNLKGIPADVDVEEATNLAIVLSFSGREGKGYTPLYGRKIADTVKEFDGKKTRIAKKNILPYLDRLREGYQYASFVYNCEGIGFNLEQHIPPAVKQGLGRLFLFGNYEEPVSYHDGTYYDIFKFLLSHKFNPDIFEDHKVRPEPMARYLAYCKDEYGRANMAQQTEDSSVLVTLDATVKDYAHQFEKFTDWYRTLEEGDRK